MNGGLCWYIYKEGARDRGWSVGEVGGREGFWGVFRGLGAMRREVSMSLWRMGEVGLLTWRELQNVFYRHIYISVGSIE